MEVDFEKQKEEIYILFNEVKLYTDLYLDEICKGKATPYICELKNTKDSIIYDIKSVLDKSIINGRL